MLMNYVASVWFVLHSKEKIVYADKLVKQFHAAQTAVLLLRSMLRSIVEKILNYLPYW